MERYQPGVQQIVFDKLPEAEARVTVCRAWRSARSCTAQAEAPPRPLSSCLCCPCGTSKELWGQAYLPSNSRSALAEAANTHAQVAALRHVHDSKWRLGRTPLPSWLGLAEHGHLAALQWAQHHGYLSTESAVLGVGLCSMAAREGQLAVLQWLCQVGYALNINVCSRAVRGAILAMLHWLYEDGLLDATTCSMAARWGHLSVLQWARANGCLWRETTCSNAAEGGHLSVLQWAHANGRPWGERTCMGAAERGTCRCFAGHGPTAALG